MTEIKAPADDPMSRKRAHARDLCVDISRNRHICSIQSLSGGFMNALRLVVTPIVIAAVLIWIPQLTFAADWPDWRGPNRDGTSAEKGLPEKWSLKGDNLAWKAPYGGRSTPVILGDR